MSDWKEVLSGAPQGSVLGPLLFSLYVNDLDEGIIGFLLKFADDCKLFNVVMNEQQQRVLQQDLFKLEDWCNKWLLTFNVKKCGVMHFGSKNNCFDYMLCNNILSELLEEVDLGVTIDNRVTFRKHIVNVVQKANKVIGMICRTFVNKDERIIMPLYKSMIRPVLDYCSQIWYPVLRRDIVLIEKVQHKVTKLIDSVKHLSYEQRLQKLQLFTLETRRLRYDLIEVFKISKGLYTNVSLEDFFVLNKLGLRGHGFKLSKMHARSNIALNMFVNRVVNVWNSLPVDTVNATTLIDFKKGVDSYLRMKGYL